MSIPGSPPVLEKWDLAASNGRMLLLVLVTTFESKICQTDLSTAPRELSR